MDNLYKEAGNRIRQLRERAQLTREAFSEIAKISAKFLYEIETGKKGFSADVLYKISKVLNVSSEYILSGYSIESDETELMRTLGLFNPEQLKEITRFLKSMHKTSIG